MNLYYNKILEPLIKNIEYFEHFKENIELTIYCKNNTNDNSVLFSNNMIYNNNIYDYSNNHKFFSTMNHLLEIKKNNEIEYNKIKYITFSSKMYNDTRNHFTPYKNRIKDFFPFF